MKLSRYLLVTLAPLALSVFTPLAWATDDNCQFNLSLPVLDYGLMNRAIRPGSAPERNLGERQLSLNLSCSKPIDMSLFYRAMAATTNRFHFADRGSYQIRIRDAVLDGQSVEIGLIAGVGQPPTQTASNLIWRPEFGIVPVQAGVPQQGRSFSAQLEVTAWVQEQGMQLRDAVTWETTGVFDAMAAGRSKEATLRARFAPAACEPVLSNGGVVDFGKLSKNDLSADKSTRLPPKSLMLRIGCDAPTAFALIMHDNRSGSATVNSEIYYGLGTDSRNNKIGLYSLNVDPVNTSADSFARLYRTDSTTGGVAWSTASASPIAIGQNSYLSFTDTPGSSAGPVMIQNLNTSVTVDAVIAPTNSLDLSTAIDLDGAGTIEIIYL
ncbi:DUF1120 domain-containing protein [Pseudomonas sp. PCH199]|uniref:DUF1120 domain-containing protein n=1 Tax=unclassified Pseudomonas TaxID=196821 RepID=UPI000BD50D0A|nr:MULTISPECIES: DUF1120 domain-containing protein [unclassified Pseudomonas]MCW8275291.1 DUF1120 domain-containing protein [Pseudomonas sp. PCH199]PAM84171.1 hypothetical protein CES87_06110 [Pseudomonas sp. ERMR1:02]